MKKLLLILLGAFALSTVTVYAQDPVEQDSKAAKLEAKEAKRKAKEEAKAKEKDAKAEKNTEKAAKKDAKLEKLQKEYEAFLLDYQPIEANTGIADVDTFLVKANQLFATMVEVEQNIGYIDVVVEEVADPMSGEMVEQATGIRNKNTGAAVKKSDALAAYGLAGLQLTTAALDGATLILSGTTAVMGAITDPLALLSIGGKVKKVVKSVKMTVNMIPIIQRRIKENTDALKFYKDNLDGEEAPAE